MAFRERSSRVAGDPFRLLAPADTMTLPLPPLPTAPLATPRREAAFV
jgi:hypothetical protein